jgi:hypothetical protein
VPSFCSSGHCSDLILQNQAEFLPSMKVSEKLGGRRQWSSCSCRCLSLARISQANVRPLCLYKAMARRPLKFRRLDVTADYVKAHLFTARRRLLVHEMKGDVRRQLSGFHAKPRAVGQVQRSPTGLALPPLDVRLPKKMHELSVTVVIRSDQGNSSCS